MRARKTSPQSRAVLAALRAQPAEWRHGYDLARLTGLSSGTLYPILIRLHERGLLEAKWVEPERPGRPARHAYRLSVQGQEAGAIEPASSGRPAREALA